MESSTTMEKSPSWSRAHDWKSCRPLKGLEGSNPSFSASVESTQPKMSLQQCRDIFLQISKNFFLYKYRREPKLAHTRKHYGNFFPLYKRKLNAVSKQLTAFSFMCTTNLRLRLYKILIFCAERIRHGNKTYSDVGKHRRPHCGESQS